MRPSGTAGGQPPQDVREHVEGAEVSRPRLHHDGCAGDPVRQPPCVAGRGEDVAVPMPEQDRDGHGRRVEAPGRAERQRIVDPAVVRGPEGLGVGLDQHGPDAVVGHDPAVRVRKLGREPGDEAGRVGPDLFGHGLGVGGEVLITVGRRGELGDVGLGHPIEPVEPVSSVRGEPDQHGGLDHALRQQGRARQRMRPAPGAPDDREPFESVGIRDGQHVSGRVSDPPPGQPV